MTCIDPLKAKKKFVWVVGGGWVKTKNMVRLRSISDLPDLDLTWTWPGPGPELDNIKLIKLSSLALLKLKLVLIFEVVSAFSKAKKVHIKKT